MNAVRLLIALMMTALFSSTVMAGSVTIYHGGGVLGGTIAASGLLIDENGNATVYVVEDLTGGGETCTPSSDVVNPTTISRSITEGGTASSQNVTVRDNCNNNLNYTAVVTSENTWISAPSSGTGTMNVTFNTSTLIEGSYTGTIDVTTTYSTRTVTVYLTVDTAGGGGEPPGTVTLTNNVAIRNVSIAPGATHYYKFTLPVGTAGVQILMGTMDWKTDQDMVISYGLPAPDPNNYPNAGEWASLTGTSNENVLIYNPPPQAGTYYIMVHNVSSISGLFELMYSAF